MSLRLLLPLTAVFSSTVACSLDPAGQPAEDAAAVNRTVGTPSTEPSSTRESTPTAIGLAPVTAEGWGPLRVGMSLAQITAAVGPDANPEAVGGADPAQCDQFRPIRAPQGVLVMVENGRLSRISLINNSQLKSDRGLGLGAAPAAVVAAYGPALRVEPHKYESAPAQYLTFWSRGGGSASGPIGSDSRGVRYEIDGSGKVASIHAGGPSISYVEGCS